MNRKFNLMAMSAVLLCSAAGVAGQDPGPGAPPHDELMGGGPLGPRMEILGFEEMHPGKVVTGAPYSAVAVTETTQTLADGTSINRKVQANLFRDSQGRVRRETTMPAIGPLAASGQSKTFVLIHDPVAGTAYALHPDKKLAMTLPSHAGGKRGADELQNKFEGHVQKEIADGTLKKEDLGTQTINGVSAQGTRYTRSIPAGQIGNDKPITVVSERWYSPDLQIVVKSTRNDPRFGQTTYTVTNIQKQEPAASLFTVPADYTTKQMHGPHGHRGGIQGAPVDMPPPPPGE